MSKKFKDLGCLSPETLEVIKGLGFTKATPVQEATIPLFMGNKDVAVDACTGSGKTLAFVVPVVEMLRRVEDPLKRHQVGAIIISPTRELARQIYAVAEPFVASVKGLSCQLLTGGTDTKADIAAFTEKGGHVLIGTPGRVDDVMKRCPAMDLKRVEVLVLDEADRLLEMGFERQLNAIIARLPKQRRTGLFSATQTEAVHALARAGLRNPVRVNVTVSAQPTEAERAAGAGPASTSNRTPSQLQLWHVACSSPVEKLAWLLHDLDKYARTQKVIVYFLTCACVDYFSAVLPSLPAVKGVALFPLHGKMKQKQRETELAKFAQAPSGALLCTDLAARGLDIPGVDWIVQVDAPQDPNAFVHRVGRTARMGRSGSALAYLLPHESSYIEFLRLRKVPLVPLPDQEGARLQGQGMAEAAEALAVTLQRMSEVDRDPMDKGVRAFLAFVRGYKEHQCKYIFRLQDLDLGATARCFGLLRLPSMPEVRKGGKVDSFVRSEVDPDSVAYRDKNREKQRVKALAGRQEKRQKEKEARQQAAAAQAEKQKEKKLTADKRRKINVREELEDLEEDYRNLKRLKKRKITESEFFSRATGAKDSEDEAEEAAAHGNPFTMKGRRGGSDSDSDSDDGLSDGGSDDE